MKMKNYKDIIQNKKLLCEETCIDLESSVYVFFKFFSYCHNFLMTFYRLEYIQVEELSPEAKKEFEEFEILYVDSKEYSHNSLKYLKQFLRDEVSEHPFLLGELPDFPNSLMFSASNGKDSAYYKKEIDSFKCKFRALTMNLGTNVGNEIPQVLSSNNDSLNLLKENFTELEVKYNEFKSWVTNSNDEYEAWLDSSNNEYGDNSIAKQNSNKKNDNLKEAYKLNNLTAFEDGSIMHGSSPVKLTPQEKGLHKYFINNYGKSISEDSIIKVSKTKSKKSSNSHKLCNSLERKILNVADLDKDTKIITCKNRTWIFKNQLIELLT